MGWADKYRTMKVRTNADTPADAKKARELGAEGIGLCRTEHMFFEGNRIDAFREMICAETVVPLPFLPTLLNMNKAGVQLVLCTMLLGFPTGSLLIDEAYHEHTLSLPQAQRLLYTCCFATPGFVIMTCGVVFYHSVKIGILLYAAQLFAGLFLLFFTRKQSVQAALSPSAAQPMMKQLSIAVKESGLSLYMIGGYLMLFLSISGVLLSFLPEAVALPLRISAEFSSGAVLLQSLPYAPILIQLLLCVLLSFGGFCVHMQIFSMVEHVPLSYGKFLLFRLLQALFSCLSFYMLQMLFL